MTRRLYFEDAFLRAFDSVVAGRREDKAGVWLRLEATAFYPEGGGQPFDTGALAGLGGECRVTEVQLDDGGCIWHRAEPAPGARLPETGETVSGRIDWIRRFDHMQQHTGEHILANCVYRLAGGFTHGLHIGQEVSSIDVTLPGGETRLPEEKLEEIETLANRRLAEDGEVVCRIPDPGELAALPLRKDPTVREGVRVCAVGDFEMVACGGTHLRHAAQAGMIKILYAQPARGKMRIFFLCGLRAARHFQACHRSLSQVGALLNAGAEQAPERLAALLAQQGEARRELAALRGRLAEALAPGLMEAARPLPDGGLLLVHRLEKDDLDLLEPLAKALIARPGAVALLCAPDAAGEACLFARAGDRGEDMRELLKRTGAKGGGRADWARGAAMGSADLEGAAEAARSADAGGNPETANKDNAIRGRHLG